MYEVKVSTGADKVVRKWKKSNPQLWKKYQLEKATTMTSEFVKS